MITLRAQHNYDTNEASNNAATQFTEPSLTKQSFKEDADINTILKRFGITGKVPEGIRPPTYGDFTGISDFHQAATAIAQANEAFMEMPADTRARFENDPGKFVDFCSDEKNLPEMRKLGLAVELPDPPQPTPEPIPAPTTPAPAA